MVTVSCFSLIFVFDYDEDEENLAVNMSTRAESRSGNARKTKTASPTVCNTFVFEAKILSFSCDQNNCKSRASEEKEPPL